MYSFSVCGRLCCSRSISLLLRLPFPLFVSKAITLRSVYSSAHPDQTGLAGSLGFSFFLFQSFRSLFPFSPAVLIERVCTAGTERKKEIDNDTRPYCVENPDLSRTKSVTHAHKPHTLTPSRSQILISYKQVEENTCTLSFFIS